MPKLKLICFGLLTSSILFSGCITKPVYIVEGIDDYVPIPVGTDLVVEVPFSGHAINNQPVSLARIKTTKPGAFFSIDAQKDALKARAK